MKVSPQLTDQADWIDGEVIDGQIGLMVRLLTLNITHLWDLLFQSRINLVVYSSAKVVSLLHSNPDVCDSF